MASPFPPLNGFAFAIHGFAFTAAAWLCRWHRCFFISDFPRYDFFVIIVFFTFSRRREFFCFFGGFPG